MILLRKHWLLLAKLAVTCGFAALLLRQVSIGGVLRRVEALTVSTVLVLAAILVFQIVLFSVRWWLIAARCEARLPYVVALRLSFISIFFNQTLPGTIGGDTVRVVMSAQSGVPVVRAFAGVAVDRGFALITLALMVLLSLPWLAHHLGDPRLVAASGLIGGAVLAGTLVAVTIGPAVLGLLSRWAAIGVARTLLLSLRGACVHVTTLAPGLALSGLIHLISAAVVVILAHDLGIALEPIAGIVLMLPSLLAMMLPVSIGGWGVREGAMIMALGQAGVSPENAFCLSVLFGLLSMMAGLPGAILWLMGGQEMQSRIAVIQGSTV